MTKGISLRGLEVFDALASSGSVAGAAQRTGLSQPAVSQQLRNLETALGTALVDHRRRPMQLTQAGHSFLARTRRILGELRMGQSELTVMDLSHLSTLTLGIIDDFDNDLTPRLVTTLAESLTKCRFRLVTAPSHEINEAMRRQDLNLALSASPGRVMDGITEYPLVRDPFILVAPVGAVPQGTPVLDALRTIPLLRYDGGQLIGRQIEAHLARLKLDFDTRFEIGSNPTLMAMVAGRLGWAITTPLGYMRAMRTHPQIEAHPLPFAPFSRTISLFASDDWVDTVPRDVARTVKSLVQAQMINPALERLPWLAGEFMCIES